MITNVLLFITNKLKQILLPLPMGTAIQACCSNKRGQPENIVSCQKKVVVRGKKIGNCLKNETSFSDCFSSKGETTVDQNKQEQEKRMNAVKRHRSLCKIEEVPLKLSFEDFHIDGVLGAGAYGTVYLGQFRKNKKNGITEKYAIKCVYKELLKKKDALIQAQYEKQIAMLHNLFIVSLLLSFQDDFRIYLVMQFAEGGDTYSLINGDMYKVEEFKSLGENGVRFIVACVVLGLEFLHSNGYVYRDLKPENVMVFGNGYAKLTDFGLATKCEEGQICRNTKGTPLYLAPQMVFKKGYDKKIDLWALGIYTYELSNYFVPFLPNQIKVSKFEQAYNDFKGDRRWSNNTLSSQLKDLIHGLINFNPEQRLGSKNFDDIKSHPFFKNFDWQALKQQRLESPLKQIVKKYPLRPEKSKKPNTQIPLSSKSCENLRFENWSYYGNFAQDI